MCSRNFVDHDIVVRSIYSSAEISASPGPRAMSGEGMRRELLRHRPGSRQRGEATRRRLVESAIEVFAARGYEGASTRLLVERAGVNLPAIQYYFRSKEGLYRAAVDHIGQRIADRMGPVTERVGPALMDADRPRRELLSLLYEMLDAFLVLIAADRQAEAQKMFEAQKTFIMRTEVERTAALDPLRAIIAQYIVGPCRALVARLIDRQPEDEQTIARTLLILGQITIFSRKGAKRDLGWCRLDEDRVRTVQELVHQHTAAILRSARGAGR